MKRLIRRVLRRGSQLPGLSTLHRRVLLPRHHGAWIYSQDVLAWLDEPRLRRQLPPHFRVLAELHRLNSKVWAGPLLAGPHLFAIARRTEEMLGSGTMELDVDGTRVWLNLADPRMLNVPNEVGSESSDANKLDRWLREGDTFIDVGANHGSFSIVAAKIVGTSGRIVAVEPQPRLARLIELSLGANAHCEYVIHNCACADTSGEADFFLPTQSSGAAGLFSSLSAKESHSSFRVRLTPFDKLFDGDVRGKAVVKVDVEGSEYLFLRGAQAFLSDHRPPIIMELNPEAMTSAGVPIHELRELLVELGYDTVWDIARTSCDSLESLDARHHRNVVIVSSDA